MNTQEPIRVIVENNKESLIDYLLNPNTIIALTAIIISILGLIISVIYNRKTLRLAYKHNKLSVEPFFAISHEYELKSDFLEISNNGLGPAKINSITYEFDKKIYKTIFFLFKENFKEYDRLIIPEESNSIKISNGYVIAPNEKMKLYCFTYKENSHFKVLDSFLEKVTVIVEYKSIYDDNLIFKDTVCSG